MPPPDPSYPVLAESTRTEDGGWLHKCGTVLLGAHVAHSVWDKRFVCAGFGDVEYETVPYCPTCEVAPPPFGTPVYV
jgi:hypothetical protein